MSYDKCTQPAIPRAALQWIVGNDTGASSITIWRVMVGADPTWRDSVPYDSADFGRCYRLLKLVPEWRGRLDEMRAVPGWAPLVDQWPELERLHGAKQQREATERIYDILKLRRDA